MVVVGRGVAGGNAYRHLGSARGRRMITRLPFALGAALMLACVFAIGLGLTMRKPPPPDAFKARWQPPPAAFQTPVRVIPITAPPQVKPEPPTIQPHRYVAPPVPLPQKAAPPRPKINPPPSGKRKAAEERDICRGKGKRYTRGGRSWRCKR